AGNSATISGLVAGSYDNLRVTVSGCTSLEDPNVTLTDPVVPTADLTSSDADDEICAGDNVVFTGSGGDEYEFLVDGGTVQALSPDDTYDTTSLSDGQVVTVRVVDISTDCDATSLGIAMTVNPPLPPPSVSVTPESCAGAATNVVDNYDDALDYTSVPNGLSVDGSGNITGGTHGTNYVLTATNADGCSADSQPFTYDGDGQLASPPPPSVSVTPESCAGTATNVVDNYDDALDYTSVPNGLSVDGSGNITGGTHGTNYVLRATNADGCSADSQPFTYDGDGQLASPPPPSVSVTPESCAGAATNVVSNHDDALDYTSVPNGLSVDGSGNITGGTHGTDYVLTATNAEGCSTDSQPFTYDGDGQLPVPDVPLVSVTPESCAGAATNVVSNHDNALDYTSVPNGLSVDGSGNIMGGATGTDYVLTATNGSNCSADSQPFTYDGDGQLPVPDVPLVSVTPENCNGAATNVVSNHDGALDYTSVPNGLSVDGSGNITGGATGTDYVLTATNADGCSADSQPFTYDGDGQLPVPDVPLVSVTPESCNGAATNVVSNHDNALDYTSVPNGLSVDGSGSITGGTHGTDYVLRATNGSNCSADSQPFTYDGDGQLPVPDVPLVSVTPENCNGAATNVVSNHDNALDYTSVPNGLSVDGSGSITGGTHGTDYVLRATNGSNCSADSQPFTYDGDGQLPVPDVPLVSVTPENCNGAATNVVSNHDGTL
ncbi:hypothetical protein, partial [Flagellimonas onchidii]|uniref:hypothetical protein n=1 Tax=Flagellimonas onchidii TaxID=2562684 RepID=UPI00197A79F1